jgi:hypothetical protein
MNLEQRGIRTASELVVAKNLPSRFTLASSRTACGTSARW